MSAIRAGYKQTEVGVIPEDWDIHTIGDSMRLINGRAFKPEDWKDNGLPIIRIQNLNDANSTFNYFTGLVEDRHRIEAGDLLFAWSGTTGSSFGARLWDGPTGVLNQHIFKVLPHHKGLTRDYAFLVLCKVQESIEKQAHGFKASFVHVKKSDLVGIQLPLPPSKAEQEAIAEALSDADALIESLEQLLAKKRHLKQGAMQELLTGKKRLPGLSGKWELKAIASFSAFVTKGATPTTYGFDWTDDGVRFLRSECVSSNGLDLTQSMFISEAAHATLSRGEVCDGDILMTITGNVGRVVRLPANFGIANINQHIARIRINVPNVSSDFVFHYLSQATIRANYALITTGQAYPQISLKQVRETLVPLPSISEQTAIASALSDMDAEIAELETQLAKTHALKQGMMQKLLTGEIRLVPATVGHPN